MRTLRFLALFLILAPAILYLNHHLRADARDARETITVDGTQRTYRLHVPPSYDSSKPAPLVIALHGRLGTGEGQERLSHFDKVSDEHGFIVVYPDGLERSWADGRGGTPADKNGLNDVKFISALIDQLRKEYRINAGQVYVTGMSNGGFITARLACDLSDKVVAVGIVAASLSVNTADSCSPSKPVSVAVFQGSEDPLVPFAGGEMGKNTAGGMILSHEQSVKKFAQLNRCSGKPQLEHIPDAANDGTTIEVTHYLSCLDGAEVRGYAIQNGGHTWPGGMQYAPAPMIGKTTHNLDASETIWEFFAAHTR